MVAGKLLNAGIFQAGWFAAVLAAAQGRAWLAALAGIAVCAVHLLRTGDRARALRLMALSGAVGLVCEWLLIGLGFAGYAAAEPIAEFPPVWLAALWLAFGTLLDDALSWLHGRYALASVLGALVAPLSYYGGEKLGGMMLAAPIWVSLMVIAALWALVMPIMIAAARPSGDRSGAAYSAASRPN
jgi:hypothetical protein